MDCLICERIELISQGANPYLARELETGYVVIGDHQRFHGYTLFLCKLHKTELHYMDREFKLKFLEEMSLVAEACHKAFEADKMNVELLGNGDAHVHFHIFPRVANDTPVNGPVWWIPREEMFNEQAKPTEEELKALINKLNAELSKLI